MEDERDDIIILVDEDGKEIEFEFLDTFEYNSNEYVCLIPVSASDTDEGEDLDSVVIMKIIKVKDGEDQLITIDDDEEYDAVYSMMEERLFEDEGCDCEDGDCDCCGCGDDDEEEEDEKK